MLGLRPGRVRAAERGRPESWVTAARWNHEGTTSSRSSRAAAVKGRIPLSRDQRKPSGTALQRRQPGPTGARFIPRRRAFRIPVPQYGLAAALHKHLNNPQGRLCRWSVYFRRGYIPIDSETRVATGPTARIKAFEVGPGVRPANSGPVGAHRHAARPIAEAAARGNSRSSGRGSGAAQLALAEGRPGSPGAGFPAASGDG